MVVNIMIFGQDHKLDAEVWNLVLERKSSSLVIQNNCSLLRFLERILLEVQLIFLGTSHCQTSATSLDKQHEQHCIRADT